MPTVWAQEGSAGVTLQIGQVIDNKYRIQRLLGEGGMGAVFEGENVLIHRRVAIKVLHAQYASNPDVVRRFEREARAAGQIGNDHILEILDLGKLADGDLYMVMEFLDGEPLSARIKRKGRLTPAELAPLASQALIGLGAAHEVGIVHRDLKPDNLYVLRRKAGVDDFVKIIDFGISKFQPLSGDSMHMTRTGAVLGTPYYMAPEQARGDRTDHRSDLYSLGVILYEALAGRVPFQAETFNELLFKIVLSDPPALRDLASELDAGFESIALKAMARDAAQRFQTAEEFRAAIETWMRTGAGVELPSAQAASAAAAVRGSAAANASAQSGSAVVAPALAADAHGAAVGTGSAPGQTRDSWAQSHGAEPVRSRAGVVVGLVGAALAVLVALGAGAAWLIGGEGDEHGAAASASGEPAANADSALGEANDAALEAVEAAVASASPVSQNTSAAPAASDAKPAGSASATPEPGKALAPHHVARPAPPPRAAPRPRPRPEPRPGPAPRPGGDDFEFGY